LTRSGADPCAAWPRGRAALVDARRPAARSAGVTGWQSVAGGLCHLLLAATLQRNELSPGTTRRCSPSPT
jgi:hypothetical protein